MLVRIAWRNIWRNKLRNLVVIISIAMGLWAGVFVLAFAWGMYQNNIHDAVYKQISHIQIHNPQYLNEMESKYSIKNKAQIADKIEKTHLSYSVSERTITTGMIASPVMATGIKIIGIDPVNERKQLRLDENLISGEYFKSNKKNDIYIGEKLAMKLKVKLKNKLVLTFTDKNNQITSAAFRVGGIFRTKNVTLDESQVYIHAPYLNQLLGLNEDECSEIAILLNTESSIPQMKSFLARLLPDMKIQDWRQLSPELDLIINSFDLYLYIMIGIILLALTFGIINTMLMSVLERVHELGMLMAIGLNKRKIFFMIMMETLFLTLIGCPAGLVLAKLSMLYFGTYGIDLSIFSQGLSVFGFSPVIYPYIEDSKYFIVAIMSFFTAIFSAIYPARKALKLNPSQAIRKI